VIPNHAAWSPERTRRTFELAPAGTPVVALGDEAVVTRAEAGSWTGAGEVLVWVDGHQRDVTALSRALP
jgi:hypothetical protein